MLFTSVRHSKLHADVMEVTRSYQNENLFGRQRVWGTRHLQGRSQTV